MVLNSLRPGALGRASTDTTPAHQDRAPACVLWLLLFLVFAPLAGVHIAFALFSKAAGAQVIEHEHNGNGRHG